jgi:transcriptional regulator with XRE-family HTH domain
VAGGDRQRRGMTRLQRERHRRGWTQQEAIDRLKRLAHARGHGDRLDGLDTNTLSRYEHGRIRRPRPPLPELFATLYQVPVEALFPSHPAAVTADRPGTLLAVLMGERRWTRERTLRELATRARQMGEPDYVLSLRQLERWLAGQVGTPALAPAGWPRPPSTGLSPGCSPPSSGTTRRPSPATANFWQRPSRAGWC